MDWRKRYRDLLERLPIYVEDARLALCGLSTFLDGYVRLHEARPLLGAADGTPESVLARELFKRAGAGIGGEFHLEWPEGGTWVEKHLEVASWGLGGTGAQAAQTLAVLGAPALISLQDRSERQLSVIHPNIQVAIPGGVVRRAELPAVPGSKPAHYIFEFTAGVRVGTALPARSSRTIVRFGNERLDDDPDFYRESIVAAGRAGAGILSGFNELAEEELKGALEETVALVQAWKRRGLALVHLELGDCATARVRDLVLEKLGGVITSLGMNHAELRGFWAGTNDAIDQADKLSKAFDLARLCVHADAWALTLTKGDPQRELEALLCGCLLAASRAEKGRPCRPAGLPAHAEFQEPPCGPLRDHNGRSVACCAAPYLKHPVATIGLGDTFLAGTVLVLGQSRAP
ncbi:MAG: 6-phosphofructokinase [Verrucomicrobia bacterium]|nr:6-phosphofructokinase [Verrucomicrobiota bacterium]